MSAQTFERGAGLVAHGVAVALALPTAARPDDPQYPDAARFFVRRAEAEPWHLLDVAALCALHHVPLPRELADVYWAVDYHAQLRAVARVVAALGLPTPSPPAAGHGPRWWTDKEDEA